MWKHAGGRHYLTQKASDYYGQVKQAVFSQAKVVNLDMDLEVTCLLNPPDRRQRDLDNAWKVISDSLTRAMVWQDDKQIRRLTLEWDQVYKGGMVRVHIAQRGEESVTS
jgi:crossover junction endodeoxyribonuclease RusA